MIKLFMLFNLIAFSTNVSAANNDKLDVTTIIVIFIIAQVLSIIGIVSLGFKKKKNKNEDIKK